MDPTRSREMARGASRVEILPRLNWATQFLTVEFNFAFPLMFLSDWSEFSSAPCFAWKKNCDKCADETSSKNCLANGRTMYFRNVFSSNFEANIPCTENHPQRKNIWQLQTPKKEGKCTLYNAKYGVCINTVSYKRLMHTNVRIEGTDHLTNTAV